MLLLLKLEEGSSAANTKAFRKKNQTDDLEKPIFILNLQAIYMFI